TYGLLAMWGYMDQAEGLEKAVANFLKGQALDSTSAEYYMSFVGREFWGEWHFQEAYTHIRQALTVNPFHTDALEAMTELLLANGYFAEAQTYIGEALRVDPLSANHHYTRANLYYYQQKYAVALQHVTRALEMDPSLALAQELRLQCHIHLGDRETVEALLAERPSEGGTLPRLLFACLHETPPDLAAEDIAAWTESVRHKAGLVPYILFLLANHPDHTEAAMDLLRELITMRRGQVMNYRYEPFLAPLRARPDFAALHVSPLQLPGEASAFDRVTDSSPDPKELAAQKARLLAEVEERHAYLDPQLSLRSLAEAIDIHPNKLSFLINDQFGQNFNEFINQYRLTHFKTLALDPENRHLTLLGLAFESGFNSKTVFNTFFKKQEGMTPRAWLKRQGE
ncbi:MAG: AraC family transcriptional regulator, partial [Bacteroidetes bacterium]